LLAVVIGTRVDWGAALPLAAVTVMVAGLLLVLLPGLALAAVLEPTTLAGSLAVMLAGAGTAGVVLFWVWFAGTTGGWLATGALLATSTIVLMSRRSLAVRRCIPVLLTAALAGGLYLGVAGDRGHLDKGPLLIEGRYLKTFDDQVPRLLADRLVDGRSTRTPPLIADWHSSDRPPLQSGMLLIAYPFVRHRPLGYFCLSIGINTLWVLGLWGLLDAVRVDRRVIPSVVLGVGLTGAVFVNNVFTWPKLLGGGLALAAAAVVVERRERDVRLMILVASACAGLALLAHGTTAFAIPSVAVLLLLHRRRFGRIHYVAGAATIAALYLPWMAYQHWYDPPGNRLLLWHLAGVSIPPRNLPLGTALRTAYSHPAAKVLGFKAANVRLLFDPSMHGMLGWTPGWGSLLGRFREAQLTRVAWAPAATIIGLPLALGARSRRPWRQPLLVLVGVTLVFWCLVEYGGGRDSQTWLVSSPYTLMLLLPALGVLGAWTVGPRAATAMLTFEGLVFLWCWTVLGLTSASSAGGRGALDPVAIALGFACASGLAFFAVGSARYGPRGSTDGVDPEMATEALVVDSSSPPQP
jgi:hypothetical protein